MHSVMHSARILAFRDAFRCYLYVFLAFPRRKRTEYSLSFYIHGMHGMHANNNGNAARNARERNGMHIPQRWSSPAYVEHVVRHVLETGEPA